MNDGIVFSQNQIDIFISPLFFCSLFLL